MFISHCAYHDSHRCWLHYFNCCRVAFLALALAMIESLQFFLQVFVFWVQILKIPWILLFGGWLPHFLSFLSIVWFWAFLRILTSGSVRGVFGECSGSPFLTSGNVRGLFGELRGSVKLRILEDFVWFSVEIWISCFFWNYQKDQSFIYFFMFSRLSVDFLEIPLWFIIFYVSLIGLLSEIVFWLAVTFKRCDLSFLMYPWLLLCDEGFWSS